jgi:hypothetical protein
MTPPPRMKILTKKPKLPPDVEWGDVVTGWYPPAVARQANMLAKIPDEWDTVAAKFVG